MVSALHAESVASGDLDGDAEALYELALWATANLRAVAADGSVDRQDLEGALTQLRELREPFTEWATARGWEPERIARVVAGVQIGTVLLRGFADE